jgi:hypothetical protein
MTTKKIKTTSKKELKNQRRPLKKIKIEDALKKKHLKHNRRLNKKIEDDLKTKLKIDDDLKKNQKSKTS